MWTFPDPFEVIVIGGGHAGCEAAHAAAKMGCRTLLLTMNLDTIAKMSCNPAVGGIGKGHMVREIDALGGLMAQVIDATGIQFRMLNASKGPAVLAPRAQADKTAYQFEMKRRLEEIPGLSLMQGTVESLLVEKGQIKGVATKEGIAYQAQTVIISSGTFMQGLLHIGENKLVGGRAGDPASVGLSASLLKEGIQLGRLKTGTPPRIHARSIDYSFTEEQAGEEGIYFSYDGPPSKRLPQVPCHITYTSEDTKKIILENLHRSPMYSGQIQSVGPRYCPSIEDKMVRFADKERHQIFLEPEGLSTQEVYVNGLSSSLPPEVQLAYLRSIPAFKNVEVTRYAYAIEYDYALSGQIHSSLETKKIAGLFFAGQINGTTGYEEAAGQGLLAGLNAGCLVKGLPSFTLDRSEAYLGVMVDDLITKEWKEPYRMFTSRAEHRLLLRQDNADLRLREYGYKLGLVDEARYQKFLYKKESLASETERLAKIFKQVDGKGVPLAQLLCRPEVTYASLLVAYPESVKDFGQDINDQIELNLKYAGYIGRQKQEVAKLSNIEHVKIPPGFDFTQIKGLRTEARLKLSAALPETLGQATRLSGVSPADISVLLIALQRHATPH